MGMTLNVATEFEELNAADQRAVMRRLGIADKFPPAAPSILTRKVARYIVANKLADDFFATIDAMRDER